MFTKRVVIFEKKDRPAWELGKKALKEAGFAGVRSGHELQSADMVCGCGAKLDPRNFGPKGKIDRETYWIMVPEADRARAEALLREAGALEKEKEKP